MMRTPRFTEDLAALPTHAFGARSLTWWGVIGYMTIEGAAFAMAFAAYFFLMSHEQGWPPEGRAAPSLLAGTLFTIVLIASEWPNTLLKKAAVAQDTEKVRRLLPIMVGIGALLLIIRAFEFPSLNCNWSETAYASIIWALLVLHTTHILTDWVDTVVLNALLKTPLGFESRRLVDVDENSLYWRFVWLTWLPIYVMIYWIPRWAP